MNALEVKNLCKTYKDSEFKLDNVNLSIPKGTIYGIVGKNGVGKSTIINTIFDIVHRDRGDVLFYETALTEETKHLKNEIGVVFDTLSYPAEIKVEKLEKVLQDLYTNFDVDLFNRYVEKFGLPKKQKLKTFSRGMTMKLSIAVALSHGAKFLILDEATAGLDPVVREEILDLFIDFVENAENAILMSSHISSDLEKVADHISFIDNGKIILTETKDKLIYEYGIARMKEADFHTLAKEEYIGYRKRGLQHEVLVSNKEAMAKKYPNFIVDNAKLDEILPILVKEAN